ncbi:MAG: hypothetical protein ACRDYU_03515, partial [Actinomycetes bacterium]
MADPFAPNGLDGTGLDTNLDPSLPDPTLQFDCQAVRGRTHVPVTVDVAFAGNGCEVVVDGPFGVVSGRGPDAFDALVAVRRRLEPEQWLLAVHGSRGDTYPDETSRRTGGLTVFPLSGIGPEISVGPLHTFGPAPFAALATVDVQDQAARPVLAALPPLPPPEPEPAQVEPS